MATTDSLTDALNMLDQYRELQNTHLHALRIVSEALGDPFKEDRSKTCIDLAKLAADAISRTAPKNEAEFAYLYACAQIEGQCAVVECPEEHREYFNLADVIGDVAEEIAYLDSRRLIYRHPKNPRWITLCDEAEPLPVVPVEGTVA